MVVLSQTQRSHLELMRHKLLTALKENLRFSSENLNFNIS